MAEKNFEQKDPFELVQMFMEEPADDSFYKEMAETFIEEYMRMGWNNEQVWQLFTDPFYRSPYLVREKYGESFVRNLIHEVRNG